ncbi:MAG: hypothetical protein GQ564_03755 [Bacteroidales bacterium]|nr:hypothetical protein [Bacteroidales bacterium]
MEKEYLNVIIGFSGFILFEECYEYNENACYIAESEDVATQFMLDCGYGKSDFRIDKVLFKNILNDYGCSCGEYAMKSIAYDKFKKVAETNNIKFTAEPFDLDSTLMVVNV